MSEKRGDMTVMPPAAAGAVRKPLTKEEARELANQERKQIRAEGVAEGKKHAGRALEWHRSWTYALLGFVAGIAVGSLMGVSMYERGNMTGGAISDRVLARTVVQPATAAIPLTICDPSVSTCANEEPDSGVERPHREPASAER